MKQFIETITDELTGLPIAGAEVFVYDDDNNFATLYASDSTTEIDNPLTTNEDGEFSFYAPTTEFTAMVYYGKRLRRRLRLLVGGGYSIAAQAAAQAALAASGVGEYADTTAGLAGTSIGETFWVDQGDGTGQVYRHDSGPVATALQVFIINPTDTAAASIIAGGVPTLASLLASSGAATIGFIQSGLGTVARTTQAKARDTVSVKDWGAVGDGSTDDVAAIEAAIAAAPVNGTLTFPAGVYIVGSQVDIARNDLTIVGYGAVLKAKASTSFEYVLYGTGISNVKIRGLTIDANQANRTSGQNVRFVGAYISLSTDCEYIDCVGKNALGYSSTPGIGLAFGGGTRCHAKNCTVVDCGGTSGTNAADGFYVSGDNCTIANCTAENCTDTGMVIENGNNSGIIGGTAKNCNAAFAITNVTNFPKRGNFIRGATAIDWNSSVTGGVQIGCPASTTGDLIDTSVDVTLVAVTGGKGTGPAINVRKVGTGKVDGLTINAVINGASTQGILVDGTNVRINGSYIRGTTNACIQFQTGATGEVNGSKLFGGSFGVYAAGTASVRTCGNNIVGNSTQSYGLYAADTSTILSEFDKIDGQTSFRTGKDGGATLQSTRFTGSALEMNGTQVVGARDTGWAADTGTAKKTANTTYTAPTISASPTQAEVQAIANALQDASRTIKALKDAGIAAGSIGT